MSITPMRYQDRFSIKKQYSFPGRKGFRIRRAAAPKKSDKGRRERIRNTGLPAGICDVAENPVFLFYRLAVVDDRCGVKEQRIVRFREVNQLSERGWRDIADINKRYFGIARSKKRRYTAAERIPENDEPAFFCGIRICDPDDRARAAEGTFHKDRVRRRHRDRKPGCRTMFRHYTP